MNIKLDNLRTINHIEAYFTITGKEEDFLNINEDTVYENDDREFVFGMSDNGIATYGCISKNASDNHEAGYRWSSRASIFNALFKDNPEKQCIEVGIRFSESNHISYLSVALRVSEVVKYLPKGYGIAEVHEVDENNNILEIGYYIVKESEYGKTYETEEVRYDDGSYKKSVKFHTK